MCRDKHGKSVNKQKSEKSKSKKDSNLKVMATVATSQLLITSYHNTQVQEDQTTTSNKTCTNMEVHSDIDHTSICNSEQLL